MKRVYHLGGTPVLPTSYPYAGTILADLFARASRLKPAAFKVVLTGLFILHEIEAFEWRRHIAQRLAQGASYRTIADELAVSKTMVTNLVRAFQNARESFQTLLPEADDDASF